MAVAMTRLLAKTSRHTSRGRGLLTPTGLPDGLDVADGRKRRRLSLRLVLVQAQQLRLDGQHSAALLVIIRLWVWRQRLGL